MAMWATPPRSSRCSGWATQSGRWTPPCCPNHLGYKTWRGRFPEAAEVAAVVTGLDELGVLATCDAVLSGYLGAVGNGDTVARRERRVRAQIFSAIYA